MYLSKENISSLKGLAILLIVIHNVVHILIGIPENEFNFSIINLSTFFDKFTEMPIDALFSFYGWLGVPFFIFASAYGLTKKYNDRQFAIINWIKIHYLKLFVLLAPAMIVYMILKRGDLHDNIILFAEQTLLLNIIKPELIEPGVWWYLGLALQFYLWFLLFRKISDKILILVAIAGWLIFGIIPVEWVEYVRYNSIGWMPEFILGILFARGSKIKSISLLYTIIFLILIVAFSFSRYTFTLCGVSAVIIFLSLKDIIIKSKILLFLGDYSAVIYVIHPVIRFIVYYINQRFSIGASALAIAMVVLSITIILALPYRKVYNTERELFKC